MRRWLSRSPQASSHVPPLQPPATYNLEGILDQMEKGRSRERLAATDGREVARRALRQPGARSLSKTAPGKRLANDRAAVDGTPMMTCRSGAALAATVAAALIGSPVAAEDAAPPSAPWELSLTPYLWALSMKGDVGVGQTEADVDASFSDILDNLNVAAMLVLELRKGRFGLLSDTIYSQLEDDAARGEDRIRIKATANMLIQELAGTYRLGTWQLADFAQAGPLSVTVDPYAGIRYTYLDTELTGSLDLPDLGVDDRRTTEADKHWVDPIVGLRTAWTLGERLSLILAGDAGGISANSQYSAQGVGLIGYRFGLFGQDNANLVVGYRALHQKYQDGDGRSAFDWDVTMHGPIAGLTITF